METGCGMESNKRRTEKNIETTIQGLMAKLIDYAGLFPPANLPLETAIRNYAAYQADKDAWMLGRFVIPASQLSGLNPYMYLFSSQKPLPISVLGRKSKDAVDCLKGLQADLAQVTSFREQHGDKVEIKVLEMSLPPILLERKLVEVIALEASKHSLQTFCEGSVPLHTDWEHHMLTVLDTIAAHNAASGKILGFKLRTGGVTAGAFPIPQQVAAVLLGCRDRGISMKFTAGLHHPIRMYRDEVNTRMHGFINVFTAGMLAHVHNLDLKATAEILADEEPASFSFTAEALAWREWTITVSEIIRLRDTALRSYGSCSFDEPCDDLRALQIL